MNESLKKPRCVAEQDRLLIHYEVWHQARCLERCEADEGVEYQMGQGQWPIQVELAMLGEPVAARLSAKIYAQDHAFGKAEQDKIIFMQAEDFKQPPVLGSLLNFDLPDGRQAEGQVLEIQGERIKVDFNHPYAGRDLLFKIHILQIL